MFTLQVFAVKSRDFESEGEDNKAGYFLVPLSATPKGEYFLIWAILVRAAPKGMVFQPFWSSVGYRFWPFWS